MQSTNLMLIEEKIVKGIELDEYELKQCAYGGVGLFIIQTILQQNHHHLVMQTIFQINQDFYQIAWVRSIDGDEKPMKFYQPTLYMPSVK